jgi:hypothetical protein
MVCLDTLIRLRRGQQSPQELRRLTLPAGMTAPMGCDAVAVAAYLGPQVLPLLPRVGCVYADGELWWWIVPSDSDYALKWPGPVRYTPGAVLPDGPSVPDLIHKPGGTVPYTPPIPLYLALCRVTGTTPTLSAPFSA